MSYLVRALGIAILVLTSAPRAWAADPTVMIVFDGSGSFWGRLSGTDRRSKLEITREALREAVQKNAAKGFTGLTSFGHRRKADCSDAEVLVPPATGSLERIMGLLDKLNPKGKGPSSRALREAAKSIGDANPASIVMLQDGPDNCQQNVCEAATEIAKTNPHLRVYTVAIGLEDAEFQRLSCVAKATNGKMFDARDAESVKSAVEEAVKLAYLIKPHSTQLSDAEASPSEQDLPTGPPGLRLSAALSAKGPKYTEPVSWLIKRDDPDQKVVYRAVKPMVDTQLKPGKYTVEASVGAVVKRQAITVRTDRPTPLRVDLQAGQLKVHARAVEGGAPLNEVVFLATPEMGLASKLTQTSPPKPIWISRDPESEVLLPAGTYTIGIEHDLIRRQQNLNIEAGGSTSLNYVMNAGHLTLSAVARTGGETLPKVIFSISEDDPESPQGRREIARSASVQPVFALPAGTYYVTARLGETEVHDRIAIGAGDEIQHMLNLGLAELHVRTALDHPLPNLPLVIKATAIDTTGNREVARSSRADPTFALPAGRYRVEARLGNQNVRTVHDITLTTGEKSTVPIKLEAASVTLRRTNSARSFGEAAWEVEDATGKIIWRSSQDEPQGLLAPGRYLVRSERGEQKFETTTEFKSGEQRTVEVGG